MAEADDLKNSLENENEHIDKFMKKLRDVNELIPGLYQRRRENEAKITFVDNVPDYVLSEFIPSILPLQLDDEKALLTHLPYIPEVTPVTRRYFAGTSSTASVYQGEMYRAINFESEQGITPEWAKPVVVAFEGIADEKTRRANLSDKLKKIQPNLGEMYIVAQSSYEKAKAEAIAGVDEVHVKHAVSDMRDVIQHLWGGLADIAKENHPENFRGKQHLQLKKEEHRDIVAVCLAANEINHKKLVLDFRSMAVLYSDMSNTEIGKNPLSRDAKKMDELNSRWVISLDDVTSLVV